MSFYRLPAALAVLAVMAVASSSLGQAAGYRLLQLDGRSVKWGYAEFGVGAEVTYGLVQAGTAFDDAINCEVMGPVTGLLRDSGVDYGEFMTELNGALRMWEAVADVRFRHVADPETADIVIGAQGEPRGIAYANVWLAERPVGPIARISRAAVCLNPQVRWERSPDGDPETYDLRHVLAHEIGHAIGLDHPGPAGQLMGYRYSEPNDGVQAGDVQGAVSLYGVARRRN